MEQENKVMNIAEWLTHTYPNVDKRSMLTQGQVLEYAAYYHAELSKVREDVELVFDYCENDEGNGCVGCLGNGKGDCVAKMKVKPSIQREVDWKAIDWNKLGMEWEIYNTQIDTDDCNMHEIFNWFKQKISK